MNGSIASITSESRLSINRVIAVPPINSIGARTPILCIIPTKLWTLYVSVVIRDSSEAIVKRSVWGAESRMERSNKSLRTLSEKLRATLAAILFAMMLPTQAAKAQTIIRSPQYITELILPSATTFLRI